MRILTCWIRGHHNPEKQILGGFRCRECHAPGADYEDMGTMREGYVSMDKLIQLQREVVSE